MRRILQRLCCVQIHKEKSFSLTSTISTPSSDMKIRYTTSGSNGISGHNFFRFVTAERESTPLKYDKYQEENSNRSSFQNSILVAYPKMYAKLKILVKSQPKQKLRNTDEWKLELEEFIKWSLVFNGLNA